MTDMKENDLDGPAAEITRVVKRSGAFDNIKKSAVDELQMLEQVQVQSSLMFSVMKVLFEQQNRSTKGVMSLAERRMQLKDNIRKGSMYKSLTNYFQESDAYKDACDRLAEEVDRVVSKHYPAYRPSEPSTSNVDIMPSFQLPDKAPTSIVPAPTMYPMPPPMNVSTMDIPPQTFAPSDEVPAPSLPFSFPPPVNMMSCPPNVPLADMGAIPTPVIIPPVSMHPSIDYMNSQEPLHVKAEVIDTSMDNNDQMDMELDSGSSRAASPIRIKEEVVDESELPPPPMPPPCL
ncbi:unnamed protein product [Bursaphelenchus xylophilus]|uniref:(pine wood nematode) hypothetical protein n=1 Tax=Bursaphelenchus xylophilus TaxID=6326 RepID=A0A1I7ST70_BURXY|nr:unnamed protein product [Bursaphelenchus xylophilus]CAG9108683.1 unnamed protein product [Bursaphelenchus xylophilus]